MPGQRAGGHLAYPVPAAAAAGAGLRPRPPTPVRRRRRRDTAARPAARGCEQPGAADAFGRCGRLQLATGRRSGGDSARVVTGGCAGVRLCPPPGPAHAAPGLGCIGIVSVCLRNCVCVWGGRVCCEFVFVFVFVCALACARRSSPTQPHMLECPRTSCAGAGGCRLARRTAPPPPVPPEPAGRAGQSGLPNLPCRARPVPFVEARTGDALAILQRRAGMGSNELRVL